MSVFVFVVEEAFDLPCLPQDYKDEIEISELVEFCNNVLLSLSFLPQKGSLMKIFFRSSERKFGMMLSSCGESLRKLLIVCEIKRFG